MSFRQNLLLAGVLSALLPATAAAAPTVTVTGDDGNPVRLSTAAPTGIRNMDVWTYRLRYTYKGSSVVAGGRVTQRVRISRRVFFG